jgi:hypothetical protein
MAIELDEWLKSGPEAPDLEEAPEGWHKVFRSFTICGEGECIQDAIHDLLSRQTETWQPRPR